MSLIIEKIMEVIENKFPERIETVSGLISRRVHSISVSDEEVEEEEKLLAEYLKLLEENLGHIYKKKTRQIYKNRRKWQDNKIDEMHTEGMIYISYWDDKEELALFLSMTYDEETDILKLGDHGNVIYLYEIQIQAKWQNQGLGSKVLKTYLIDGVLEVLRGLDSDLLALMLTVFSENTGAIRFYTERLLMKKSASSPRDDIIITATPDKRSGMKARLRSSKTQRALQEGKKPAFPVKKIVPADYYILCYQI